MNIYLRTYVYLYLHFSIIHNTSTMYLKYFAIFLICLFTLSCSKNDNPEGEPSVTISTKVTLFIQDLASVYLIDIVNGTMATNIDIGTELGVPINAHAYGQNHNPNVSFYETGGIGGGYRLWEKNLDTGANFQLDGICDFDPLEIPFSLSSTPDYFFVLTTDSDTTGAYLNLRVYNRGTNVCEKVVITAINFAPYSSQRPIKVGNYLYIYHDGVMGQGVVSKLNLTNFTFENQLTLESAGSVTVINNVLHVFINDPDIDHYEYNLNTFELLRSNKLAIPNSLGVGMFDPIVTGESMLLSNDQAQPSPISVNPTLVNLNSGLVTLDIDMNNVKANLDELYPNSFVLLESQTQLDVINEILVGVFSVNSGQNDLTYAVYYVDYNGNILNLVPLDFKPYTLSIR